jgi:hypothetical protein
MAFEIDLLAMHQRERLDRGLAGLSACGHAQPEGLVNHVHDIGLGIWGVKSSTRSHLLAAHLHLLVDFAVPFEHLRARSF